MTEPDEGIDIVKFFLGVMTLLTVFVAGFAIYNWSKAKQFEAEVQEEEYAYRDMQKIAGKKEFLEKVSRFKTLDVNAKVTADDFGRFLTDQAKDMNLSLNRFRSVGTGGTAVTKGFTKSSYEFSIDKQNLQLITAYLWYIQAFWRGGLKIEAITLKETSRRRGDPFAGWDATATASIFKPKEGGP